VIVLGVEELEVGVLTEGILGARAVPVPEFHAVRQDSPEFLMPMCGV
jgi:hypothetical protein